MGGNSSTPPLSLENSKMSAQRGSGMLVSLQLADCVHESIPLGGSSRN